MTGTSKWFDLPKMYVRCDGTLTSLKCTPAVLLADHD
jgi:hypothetical protein